MKLLVAVEGKVFPDGRQLAHGAVYEESAQPVPVTWGYGIAEVVGTASNLERDDKGHVFAEVEFSDDKLWLGKNEPEDFVANAFLKPLVMNDDETVVLRGRLRSVGVALKATL